MVRGNVGSDDHVVGKAWWIRLARLGIYQTKLLKLLPRDQII